MAGLSLLIALLATTWVLLSGPRLLAAQDGESLALSVTMTTHPEQSFVRDMDGLEVGFGRMEAGASAYGKAVRVELLRHIEYRRGSGPLAGFFTLSWERGDVLALRYRGETFQSPDGTATIDGTLEVVGGVGKYARATGHGVVHGFRSGRVGNAVVYTLHVEVEQPEPRSPASVPIAPTPAAKPVPNGRGWEVALDSKPGQRFFHDVGALRDVRYGSGLWLGSTRWKGNAVAVELVGLLECRDGNGPFSGFLVLESPDGSAMLCRCSGTTFCQPKGGTSIHCNLEVIHGSGRWASSRASGTLVAGSPGDADGTLSAHVDLNLD